MKELLILSAAYGEGHNAAARGLLAGFEQTGRGPRRNGGFLCGRLGRFL